MKKIIRILWLMMLIPLSASAEPDTLWTKTFGGPEGDMGRCVRQTNDGGYIFTGYTSSYSASGYDIWLIKTDAEGDTLWTRTYGGSSLDYGYSVQQTEDSGYIIAGSTSSNGYGRAYLIKTDACGDTLWTKTYGPEWVSPQCLGTVAACAQQTHDGGYIFTGYVNNSPSELQIWLVKMDALGDTIWTRLMGGENDEMCYYVQETDDRGYILVGCTSSYGAGNLDAYLIKTDANGDTLWTRTFGDVSGDEAWCVQQTNDGGYIATGYFKNATACQSDVYLIRMEAEGDTIWTKTIGGEVWESGWSVDQTHDGGYVIAGGTNLFPTNQSNVWIIRTDSNGDTLWTKTLDGAGGEGDCGLSIQQTDDYGYIITGHTNYDSYSPSSGDIWLIRLEDDLSPVVNSPGQKIPDEFILYPPYPNPFNSTTKVSFTLPEARLVSLNVYNMQGHLVLKLVDGWRNVGVHEITWDAAEIASGIYIYRLAAGNFTASGKMVLMK